MDGEDRAVWGLSDVELIARIDQCHAREQQAAAEKLAAVAEFEARNLARRQGASSTTSWLRDRLRLSSGTCHRMVELARALDRVAPQTRQALADGALNAEQASVIAAAVRELPVEAGPEVAAKAEALLVEQAQMLDPKGLRIAGGHILGYIAPDLADEHERRQLEQAEKRAYERRTFTLSPDGAGGVRLHGLLDQQAAATVSAALDPLSRRAGQLDERTPGQRRADALVDVCQLALDTETLPEHGGDRPGIVVTLNYDLLRQQVGAGTLDTGERLSPEAVRRLACDARVIPAVLGGQGQVLDVGRERRLFTGPLRRALAIRDGGCAFPACDRAAKFCHAHHAKSWLDGGPTCLANGVLLCGVHHVIIHSGEWQVYIAADGMPEFVPPTWIDEHQRPRRNNRRPPPGHV
ncbi:MAG: DUF222 domain-containing protein [Micromonosporaceae bacterium]|nr:DUF222 domain-containing protein [Micromonosporaceae bacterium]